ncbi:MAG: hypothetical protein WCG94_02595 [Methanothrix sp.]
MPFNYPDLLFCPPVKLVDLGVDLPVRGLDAPMQDGILVRRAGFGAR